LGRLRGEVLREELLGKRMEGEVMGEGGE